MEQGQGGLGVLHGIKRLVLLAAGALGLAVAPLGLELLDVGGVTQHDAAQFGGGPGGKDWALVAVFHHEGDTPRMVDVGVGQQHAVHLAGGQGQGLVLVDVAALLHAAVHHQVEAAGRKFHTLAPPFPLRAVVFVFIIPRPLPVSKEEKRIVPLSGNGAFCSGKNYRSLESISARMAAKKASTLMVPPFSSLRARTATVPSSISLSPTTSM